MEETGKICPTKLISDAPAKEDAFKSHDRVARAIVDLVTTEPGGLTIGVEGAWGTGKSTIIKFVIDALSADRNIALVSFDAWAHQGDPLRRSFLERLISVITNKGWVDKERWQNALDALARRIHKSSTTTTPTLTREGRWLAASVLLIPVGAAILEPLLEAEPRTWPEGFWGFSLQVFTWLSAFGLSFAPFIVALFIMRNRGEGKPFWGFFADEQTTREDSESTEDPEPTSLEFSKRFTDLLEEALKDETHKVVIIVDNLDRIPEDFASSMWSTMRTFLEHGEYQRKEWFSRIWVIVPYAMESLKKTLGTYSESKDKNGSVNDKERKDDEEREVDGIFSFIDKVFQIHFYVSPPVLSDWKSYLTSTIQQAFPKHKDDEAEIHRIYRTWMQNAPQARRPTPRDLVIFVNDIGALHRQWQHSFPLSRMAYYCLIRRKYEDVAKKLLDGTLPTQADKDLLGQDLADTIAALYFNREVSHAKQLLLKPELTRLLASGETSELIGFSEKHPGLYTVLEQQLEAILSDWLGTESATIAKAAKCLLSDGGLAKASQAEAQSIRNSLFDTCEEAGQWSPLDADVIRGLSLTVAAKGTPDFSRVLLNTLKATYAKNEIAKSPDFPDVALWIGFYIEFLKDIKSHSLLPEIDGKDLIPGGPREWVIAGQFLKDLSNARDLSATVVPNFDMPSLTQEYLRVILNDTFDQPHQQSLQLAIRLLLPGPNYKQIAQTIQARLENNPATTSSRARSLFYALWKMRDVGGQPYEAALSSNGILLHYYQAALGVNDHATAAFIAYLMIANRPQLSPDRHIHNSQAGYASIQKLFNEPENYPNITDALVQLLVNDIPKRELSTLLNAAVNARKLLRYCVVKMAEENIIQGVLGPEELLVIWPIVDEVDNAAHLAPATLSKVILANNQSGEFAKLLTGTKFDVSNARLYTAQVMTQINISAELKVWLQSGLDGVGVDIWKVHLMDEGELISLVELARYKDVSVETGVKFLDALCELADTIADGKATGKRQQERWPQYFELLQRELRPRLGKKLLDITKNKHGNIHEKFFAIFGGEAFARKVIEGDKEVIPRILTDFVIVRNIRGLRVASEIIRLNSGNLVGLGESHDIAEFKLRVKDALNQRKGDEADLIMDQIAKQLDIKLDQG